MLDVKANQALFQSTLSVRRATRSRITLELGQRISIHALRKESDYVTRGHIGIANISIHALRKESDWTGEHQRHDRPISIHALRKESD